MDFTPDPRRCSNCAEVLRRPHRNGRCQTCAMYLARRGAERPRWRFDPMVPRRCAICNDPMPKGGSIQGRCSACYQYWRRHGVERPAWLQNPRLERTSAQ